MRTSFLDRFDVLKNRNFRLYFIGQFISLTGMWMQAIAASWVVLGLTDSTFALAIVNFAVAIPGLILMLYGGVAADRFDRHRILVVTQAILMVLALIGGVLVATGLITFWIVVVLSLVVGIAIAFDMPAQQALVPDLVEPQQIPRAVALNQVIFNGSRLVGPAVGGALIAATSLASAYFANGISYIAVILSLVLLRLPPRKPSPTARSSMMGAMREGVGHVWRSPLIRSLMAVSACTSLLVFPAVAIFSPAYVKDALGMGPGTTGLLAASSGAASMFGAFAMLWIPAARRGLVMLGCIGLSTLALATLSLTHSVAVATVAFAMLSLGMSLLYGLNATTIQVVTSDSIRGRVMSVSGMTFSGITPFAAILVGAAIEASHVRLIYGLSGALYVLLAMPLLVSSGILGRAPVPPAEAEGAPVALASARS